MKVHVIVKSLVQGNIYGNCCGRTCGGYEGGKPAIEHFDDGLFDNAPVTEWKRGEPAEVYWLQQADHRGGYAYRLCKVTYFSFNFFRKSVIITMMFLDS